jgi:hypothetical protein
LEQRDHPLGLGLALWPRRCRTSSVASTGFASRAPASEVSIARAGIAAVLASIRLNLRFDADRDAPGIVDERAEAVLVSLTPGKGRIGDLRLTNQRALDERLDGLDDAAPLFGAPSGGGSRLPSARRAAEVSRTSCISVSLVMYVVPSWNGTVPLPPPTAPAAALPGAATGSSPAALHMNTSAPFGCEVQS